jgi:hypothetical protein
LIEQHGSAIQRIKKLTVFWTASAAGPTMQKNNRNTLGIAALFKINCMSILLRKQSMMKRCDGWK